MHNPAPREDASSVFGPGETVVATRAPASRAIWTDMWPTPPAPACTSTNWPSLTRARPWRASQAVMVTNGAAAASTKLRLEGFFAR